MQHGLNVPILPWPVTLMVFVSSILENKEKDLEAFDEAQLQKKTTILAESYFRL